MPIPVDLRSDTVTRPTPAMRAAMAEAPVGDDVFGEDPTVNALQEMAAGLLGKEAALFVPSGTMANQIAIRILTDPGDEVLLDAQSHPISSESGAAAVISSVTFRPLPGHRGLLSPEQVRAAVRPENIHYAPARLCCLENTHNQGGGSVYALETVAAIRETAADLGLSIHLDGARLFNACAATGHAPSDYARHADTVSFCLSKGLGAPVGSILAGSRGLMKKALRWRKVMGGGMRQAGILAAGGIYALTHHVARLAEDHENAAVLAQGLAGLRGLEVRPEEVETNIVIFRVTRPGLGAAEFVRRLAARQVLMLPFGPDAVRAVTHLDVNRAGMETAIQAARAVLELEDG
jgi:threonine aldolase